MIHFIIGTRAQLIKIAPVMIEMEKRDFDYSFIFTGQHNVTIDELINIFGIKQPDLNLYEGDEITNIIQVPLWSLKCIFKSISYKYHFNKEDIILVHGDAYSSILGVLIAKLFRIKIGHIEAGYRSYDYFNPFPEEIIRVLISKFSAFHFCPSKHLVNNIKNNSGIKINIELNTLYDTLMLFMESEDKIEVDIPRNRYSIVSIHRFENIYNKERLKLIVDLLNNVSENNHLLFILHPSTKNNLQKYGLLRALKRNKKIELRPRYDYFRFIELMMHSEFVITDGGSNQQECYYMGIPCLLFRNKTESFEGIGRNIVLSKFDKEIICNFVDQYEGYRHSQLRITRTPSKIIVDFLKEALSK